MIIQCGDADAVSFNDDSSPHASLTSGFKVAVDAQVIRDRHLDWFFRLLKFGVGIPGELKSSGVWTQFENLPRDERVRIWLGLSKVRIHIVDPRPYSNDADDILRSAWGRRDAPEILRRYKLEGYA